MYKNTTASRFQHQFNAGSINVRTATCDAKCEEVIAREADRTNLTICGLQKTRQLKKGKVILNIPLKKSQYIFHWSGFERKREYSVGLLIRKSPFIQVENVNYQGPRHISALIVIKEASAYMHMHLAISCDPLVQFDDSIEFQSHFNLQVHLV